MGGVEETTDEIINLSYKRGDGFSQVHETPSDTELIISTLGFDGSTVQGGDEGNVFITIRSGTSVERLSYVANEMDVDTVQIQYIDR